MEFEKLIYISSHSYLDLFEKGEMCTVYLLLKQSSELQMKTTQIKAEITHTGMNLFPPKRLTHGMEKTAVISRSRAAAAIEDSIVTTVWNTIMKSQSRCLTVHVER